MKKVFNHSRGKFEIQWNESEATSPVEILINEAIGEDPWDGIGMSSKSFNEMLNQIPRNRKLNILVNSPGGDVYEGMAIRNLVDRWPEFVTVDNIGVAASTASWCFLNADKVRAYKNSQFFAHDAMSFCFGNAADMTKAAKDLDLTSNQIAEMYAEKSGKSVSEMRSMMQAETLLTGQQALEAGFVDELIEGDPVTNFTAKQISNMKGKLLAMRNSAAQAGKPKTKNNIMTKEEMLALLAEWGVAVPDGASDDDIKALVKAGKPETEDAKNPDAEEDTEETKKAEAANKAQSKQFNALQKKLNDQEAKLKELTELNNASKKERIKNAVRKFIDCDEPRLTEKEFEKAVARAYLDEGYLNEIAERPVIKLGTEPVAPTIELVSEAFSDIQKHILENSCRFREKFIGNRGAGIDMKGDAGLKIRKDISNRSKIAVAAIRKHKNKILEAWNSNSIDAALQRQVILTDMLEAFQPIIMQLDAFSVVYNNVPLEGTDKIDVPYFPLATTASNSWAAATGYAANLFTDWNEQYREIAVGGSGLTSGSSAATGTAKDRLWRGLIFTSYDFARQPYLNATKLFQQEAQKLGIDVFTQIISRVLTAANYGAAALTVPAASFDADAVATLRTAATGLNWPLMNRSLTVDHTYWGNLIKDPTLKANPTTGNATSEVLSWGRMSNIYGFENALEVPNLSTYSPSLENLIGWINHKSAMLVATSPIMPAPAVRQLLISYDVITDPKTGVSFEYRYSGDTTLDQQREVIECSFGAEPGVQTALQRLTSS